MLCSSEGNVQELEDMLKEYDMKRDSVEINRKASQWCHNAGWNRKYMEPRQGYTLKQLWEDSETAIGRKTSSSYDIKDNDIRRAVDAIANLPAATSPESPLLRALGTPAQRDVPPQNGTLAQRILQPPGDDQGAVRETKPSGSQTNAPNSSCRRSDKQY